MYPKDKFDNEIERGDLCAMENGGTITLLLYSHRANSTYVFLREVDGQVPEMEETELYCGDKRFIQHSQVGTKVINLTKLKSIKTVER